MLHVFIGTKAQYIKTAPVVARLEREKYRLIDSGQHAELAMALREVLGIGSPDVQLGGGQDVVSIPQAVRWGWGLISRLPNRSRLKQEVFGGQAGICLVHGDTPSTLLGAMLARRAGLAVAHLESGLRSGKWLHPFPEEMIRYQVARKADVLFAPDVKAADHLRQMGAEGQIVETEGNTLLESLRAAHSETEAPGPAVVTMHRVENLHRRSRREGLVRLVEEMARHGSVRLLLHGPTSAALGEGCLKRLAAAGVEITPLVEYRSFVRLLASAPLVVTDGGSIQEECALLGVPTLLWRGRTERTDGLGANVVLSNYDLDKAKKFLKQASDYRQDISIPDTDPSRQVVDALRPWL